MDGYKTRYVPVMMTPAEYTALRSMADKHSCSVSAVVRWAVRKMVLETSSNRQEITGADGADIKIAGAGTTEGRRNEHN